MVLNFFNLISSIVLAILNFFNLISLIVLAILNFFNLISLIVLAILNFFNPISSIVLAILNFFNPISDKNPASLQKNLSCAKVWQRRQVDLQCLGKQFPKVSVYLCEESKNKL